MSCLLVDLGNTRCKLALGADGAISRPLVASYDDGATLDGYLTAHATGLPVLIASVANASATSAFVARLQDAGLAPIRLIKSTDQLPMISNGYRKPEQLGIDRLLAMVAARAVVAGPLCVVDAGTAVTIDFVDAGGQHLGGFILPGQLMARDCLLAKTAIPQDPEIEANAVVGRDTATAVALGARYAVAGVVEHFVAAKAGLGNDQPPRVVVGGGDAAIFAPLLPPNCITLNDLVLRGLAVVAANEGG